MTNYELIHQFEKTRAHSVALCAPLAPEDYNSQPVAFASPPKWHLAHITWFFEEMILKKYDESYVIFNKDFSYLFNSYYQTVGERAARSLRGAMTRPLIEEIYSYRTYVDKHIVALLKSKLSLEIETLVTLGIQHEQQHQELLLTDLKHTFSFNPLHPVYHEKFNLVQDTNNEEGWLAMPEGIYEIGHQGDGFCFDNELGRHKVFLHDYQLSKGLVTNGDFIAFIAAGGYQEFKYWLDEGWSWVQEEKITAPLYWIQKDGTWFYYTLAGLKPVDVDAILSHVSFYEAQAFATFKNMRLPTEFEWEAASEKFNWGKRWEWTYSAYVPYPNFKIADGAVGEYNGKFMINTMVLRGSSVATSEGHERNTYRNFFHPKYRWQYTGIRLAK
ncbi:ergothioneine biosynthesis protein EgtB [Cellulophaga sp. HaHa_2_95]|uniref:ergothioneine biosynthesis protein EgtB n=1 Tax=Cellulophaga sp. HaHa_2_95 TaxID=2745558 RepID=UPI001C4FDF95|nr:ergothioneine biosynthesis protein EgtB [Cellulophaga sp. HaHa_2_95]QXP54465.1 ergothioneine biosynthesis protein EgtB [Cellulophaga sp. HaHa_2_95]